MIHATDPRLTDAKAMPMAEVVSRLAIDGLVRCGHELVGPCPRCGGTDRFGVNTRDTVFGCRQCKAGGDQVALVAHVLGLPFLAALDWLCGPRVELTAEQQTEQKRRTEAAERARDSRAQKERAAAIAAARTIWAEGLPPEDTPVRDYLARRGISRDLYPTLPKCLRFHPRLSYMVSAGNGLWRAVHHGPAMLAAVQGMNDRFGAVHRTWLDLDQPKGKIALPDPDRPGAMLAAKKGWGSKKGGAIRLSTPPGATTLIMAEGIETTLSALVADCIPNAAYWAGVDLGNMAGRMLRGVGLKYAGLPDLGDGAAFVPPPWVRRLIFIQDGDSEPRHTRAQLLSGTRRAMALRPGLTAQIVPVAEGFDLNDLLMEVAP